MAPTTAEVNPDVAQAELAYAASAQAPAHGLLLRGHTLVPVRHKLEDVVRLDLHRLVDADYIADCRSSLERDGALTLANFLRPGVADQVARESLARAGDAFFSKQVHNVYLDQPDPAFPTNNARSRTVVSTKGALTHDQVPDDSALRIIYDSPVFRSFLAGVLDEEALFPYADPLSSINVNFYEPGQELGWHFDNSSFSVTLLLQEPDAGGRFEFHPDLRDTTVDFHNELEVASVLDGSYPDTATKLLQAAGDLVLFRGREALHRVVPVGGQTTRIQVVLAYNTEPDLSLSENARLTFFGRLR